jgi:hypothetical protein
MDGKQQESGEASERLEASSSQAEQNGSATADLAEWPASLQTPITCINLLRCSMQVCLPVLLQEQKEQPVLLIGSSCRAKPLHVPALI